MEFRKTARGIFLRIAKKLGYELQEKEKETGDYADGGVNPTAIISDTVATLTLDDSDIVIDGENMRAEKIREIAELYSDTKRMSAACVALGTGDVILRPYTDGTDIDVSIIRNEDFRIIKSIGQSVKAIIMKLDSYVQRDNEYELYEAQILKDDATTAEGEKIRVVDITRHAIVNGSMPIALEETNWAGIAAEEVVISDQLLVGRIKCPTINRKNPNDINGVPITYKVKNVMDNIRKRYDQFNSEFDSKESMIFADKTLFKTIEVNGEQPRKILPRGNNQAFELVKGATAPGSVKDMIDTYSPDIRDQSLKAGSDFNLSILEMCCGLSRGVLTTPETSFATATEMKNSLKKTFSFISRFRKNIQSGERQLFKAIDTILNVNNVTLMGQWDLKWDWSYDYIEESRERFNQLLQAHSAGVLKDEELRAWTTGESIAEAKEVVEEMRKDLPDIDE